MHTHTLTFPAQRAGRNYGNPYLTGPVSTECGSDLAQCQHAKPGPGGMHQMRHVIKRGDLCARRLCTSSHMHTYNRTTLFINPAPAVGQ